MALQTSGEISIGDIAAEFGGTAPHALSEYYGAAAGVPTSGAIKVGDSFYGKSSLFVFSITSNQTNANLATLATAAGWDGSAALEVTINSGVYITSNSTATPALTVSGSFPAGVTLTNNGTIIGMGGHGGNANSGAGGAGGTGLSTTVALTLHNAGTIAGGGGGGGAGRSVSSGNRGGGGGGGGGGQSSLTNSSGGSRTSSWGYCGIIQSQNGAAGTISGAGAGGNRGRGGVDNYGCAYTYGVAGAAGGSWGANGSSSSGSGGSGGACTSGASNITWSATGTRYGAIG